MKYIKITDITKEFDVMKLALKSMLDSDPKNSDIKLFVEQNSKLLNIVEDNINKLPTSESIELCKN
jgi:hypothetical protein